MTVTSLSTFSSPSFAVPRRIYVPGFGKVTSTVAFWSFTGMVA